MQAKREYSLILKEIGIPPSIQNASLEDTTSVEKVLVFDDTPTKQSVEITSQGDVISDISSATSPNISFSVDELVRTKRSLLEDLFWIQKAMLDRIDFLKEKHN